MSKEDIFFPFFFSAPIEKFGVGRKKVIWYNVLFVPGDLCAELPLTEFPRLRVEGEIADVPVAIALMPTGDGRHYVIVAPNVLKDSGVRLGDRVEMRFKIADQDFVDVPDMLGQAIERSSNAKKTWAELTRGKQRMLSQHVRAAKTEATQHKRVAEVLGALLEQDGDLRAWLSARRKENRTGEGR